MKKEVHKLFILLSLLIISNSCKKQSVLTHYIPNTLKEYGIFKAPSYWIYKNDNTGIIDSTFIMKNPSFRYDHLGGDEGTDVLLEKCDVSYHGSFIFSGYLDSFSYSIYVRGYSFECIDPSSYSIGQIFNLEKGTTLTNEFMLDSLLIYEKTFHNVFVTSWQQVNLVSDTCRLTSYFVKGIGLVKFSKLLANTDSTWNLINYHVFQ